MNSRRFLLTLVTFLVMVAVQWLVARNLALFHLAFCFTYVGAILLLPIEMEATLVMIIACATGLTTDAFYDTPGLHGAACTLMALFRPLVLRLLAPPGGYEDYMEPSIGQMGGRWFFTYTIPLVLIHHVALFILEHIRVFYIPTALLKAALSTLFTIAVILLVQYALWGRRTQRTSI